MLINNSKELARRCKVSEPTIVRWRERGMPFEKVGIYKYKYNLDKVLTWLAQRSPQHLEHVKEILRGESNG